MLALCSIRKLKMRLLFLLFHCILLHLFSLGFWYKVILIIPWKLSVFLVTNLFHQIQKSSPCRQAHGRDASVVIIRYVNTRSTALSLTHATESYWLELPRGAVQLSWETLKNNRLSNMTGLNNMGQILQLCSERRSAEAHCSVSGQGCLGGSIRPLFSVYISLHFFSSYYSPVN